MKRSLKSIILLCVLAVCVGGYLLISNQTNQATTAATENEESVALTSHTLEELSALSWTTDDGTLRFTKSDAGWRYDADSAFPANETTLDGLADKLISLTADRSVDNVTDLSIYGLSEPSFTVTAEWSDGTSTAYGLGDATAFADGYYVSRSGDEKVYIVSTSLQTTFQKELNSLAVKETIPTAENVTRITTADVDASYEETSRTINTDQHWYAADGTVLDDTSVQSIVSSLKSVSWDDLVTGSATEEQLSDYGLADSAAALCLYDGDTAALTLLIGGTNEDGDYYAKLPDSRMVYTIAASDLSGVLAATNDSLKAENVLLTLPYDDVQAAKLAAGSIDYTLQTIDQRPVTEETTETTEDAEATEAESTEEPAATAEPVVDPTEDDEALWKQLIAITATGIAEEKDGETVLTVSVTNMSGISAELVIREYDADSYQASLDGDAAVTVSADKVDKLIRTLKQMQ